MTDLILFALIIAAWLAIQVPVAIVTGRAIRLADERAAADPERVL